MKQKKNRIVNKYINRGLGYDSTDKSPRYAPRGQPRGVFGLAMIDLEPYKNQTPRPCTTKLRHFT